MEIKVHEANERKNGNIIINGWVLHGFDDLRMQGTEKQLEYAKDLLARGLGEMLEQVGGALGLIVSGRTNEENLDKLMIKLAESGAIKKLESKLLGQHASLVIDAGGSVKAIMAQ